MSQKNHQSPNQKRIRATIQHSPAFNVARQVTSRKIASRLNATNAISWDI